MEKERKNKKGNPAMDDGDQDFAVDDEDAKVEKFFAIIRRLRDAREFSTNSLREMEARKLRMKKAKKVQVPVWIPSFKLEDFEGLELADHITQPSSSNKEQQEEKKQELDELDLNLSL